MRAAGRAGASSAGRGTPDRCAAACRGRDRSASRRAGPALLPVGIADLAAAPPPRSKTRRTLPGCVISQRGSGSRKGSHALGPHFLRRRRRQRLQPLRRAVAAVALAEARILVGRRRCCRARRPTASRRASSCSCGRCALRPHGTCRRSSATRRSPGLTNWMYSGRLLEPLRIGALGVGGRLPRCAHARLRGAPSALLCVDPRPTPRRPAARALRVAAMTVAHPSVTVPDGCIVASSVFVWQVMQPALFARLRPRLR